MEELRLAMAFEARVAKPRSVIETAELELGSFVQETSLTLAALRLRGQEILRALRSIEPAALAVLSCPRPEDAKIAIHAASAQAFEALCASFEELLQRHAMIERSRDGLERLKNWFSQTWIENCAARIAANADTSDLCEEIRSALPTLVAYQRFRMLASGSGFPAAAIRAFAMLRRLEDGLKALAPYKVDEVVRRTLKREALLAWKGRMETIRPELLADGMQIQRKVENS